MRRVSQRICIALSIACFLIISLQSSACAETQGQNGLPWLSLLLLNSSSSATLEEQNPVIALLVSKDTDTATLAWLSAGNGKTKVEDVIYEVHFSTQEEFTPSRSTLKKTVTGEQQATVNGLAPGTTYYVMVVASFPDSSKLNSGVLWVTTFPEPVKRAVTPVKIASELGLGHYTTSDGTTYVFDKIDNPTLPEVGDLLFAENSEGGITLRLVDSVIDDGTTITVGTSDASLDDVFEDGTVSSVFQIVELDDAAVDFTTQSNFSSKSSVSKDGSQRTRVDWPDRLLTAEQIKYSYNEEDLDIKPGPDPSSYIVQSSPDAATSEFIVSVTPSFQPTLETRANWSGFTLNSAVVTARGTLDLEVLGQYNFTADGTWSKEFELFSRFWTSVYLIGGVPVMQQITLSFKVSASATAMAKIQAETKANISRTVELGATYTQAGGWVPYMNETHNESLTAKLDIGAEATADIRIIPEIKVTYYTVISGYLTVEPFVRGAIAMETTTNNIYFFATHPERLLHLTKFESALGLECFVGVDLTILGNTFAVLEKTCVLGPPSNASCINNIPELMLFTIPTHAPDIPSNSETGDTSFSIAITDGVLNEFDPASIMWEVYADDPEDDATVTAGTCSTNTTVTPHVTTCGATLSTDDPGDFAIFVSGHGILGTLARHFNEIPITINTSDNCVYILEIDDNGTHRYIRGCRDPDDYSKYTTIYHIFNKNVDIIQYVDEGVGETMWENTDWPHTAECTVVSGWSLRLNIDRRTWEQDVFSYMDPVGHPGTYRHNYDQTVVCWPEPEGEDCGPYVCPDPDDIPTLYEFPGDCHAWWGHTDETGTPIGCIYP